MSRFLRGRAAPSKKVEAEPAPLVASDPASEEVAEPMPVDRHAGRKAMALRRSVKEIIEDYQAEIARHKAKRSAPMIMGAPPPVTNIDVSTDELVIGGSRATNVFLGKRINPDDEDITYNGVRVRSNHDDPELQPDVFIGGFDDGDAGAGSIIRLRGSIVTIESYNEATTVPPVPGIVDIYGNVSINGLPLAGVSSPSYIEAWGSAASVAAGADVPYTAAGATTGTVTVNLGSGEFTIPTAHWGTYEVTWRAATTASATFLLFLVSGTLAAPDGAGPAALTRTQSGLGVAGMVTGQAFITLAENALSPVVFTLRNPSVGSAALYTAATNSVSIMVRRVSQ